MLIGNRNSFALELTPVEPSWDVRYAPEAAAWAGLSLWVEGRNLCAHIREGEEELRKVLFVPLGPIADWFVRSYAALAIEQRVPWLEDSRRLHDVVRRWGQTASPAGLDEDAWLDLREAFWSRHFLVAGADGSCLPNVAFLRQDDEVAIAWAPPRLVSGSKRTWLEAEGSARVMWREVNTVLHRFVDEVASSFERKHLTPYIWVARQASRIKASVTGGADDLIALFCARSRSEVASLLGVPEADLATAVGEEAAQDPSASAILQVVRDLPPVPSFGVGAEARAAVDASGRCAAGSSKQRWTDGRALARDAASAAKTAEEAGQLAARSVRVELGLDGPPIPSTADVLARFGLSASASGVETAHENMLVAAVPEGVPAVIVLQTATTVTPWGRRFEEARAIGHALLDPLAGGAFGAASTRWSVERRRRRSGAFAAELLLPEVACEEASQGHLDGVSAERFEALLARFNVGAMTAAYQLYNHKWLSRPVRGELIERFKAKG